MFFAPANMEVEVEEIKKLKEGEEVIEIRCGVICALYLLFMPREVEMVRKKAKELSFCFRMEQLDAIISTIQIIFLKTFENCCEHKQLDNLESWMESDPKEVF